MYVGDSAHAGDNTKLNGTPWIRAQSKHRFAVICPESNSYSFFLFIYNNSILYACSPRVVCARVVCLVTSLECQAGSKAPDW